MITMQMALLQMRVSRNLLASTISIKRCYRLVHPSLVPNQWMVSNLLPEWMTLITMTCPSICKIRCRAPIQTMVVQL